MYRRITAAVVAALAGIAFTTGAFAQNPAPTTPPAGKMAPAGKTPQARDSKGRFVKKGVATPAASGKKGGVGTGKMTRPLPPRDAKGRFMKKGATTPAMSGTKGGMATGKMGKTMPARDSKGRFVKKGTTAPAATTAPKAP